jgi:hypothetical protein
VGIEPVGCEGRDHHRRAGHAHDHDFVASECDVRLELSGGARRDGRHRRHRMVGHIGASRGADAE